MSALGRPASNAGCLELQRHRRMVARVTGGAWALRDGRARELSRIEPPRRQDAIISLLFCTLASWRLGGSTFFSNRSSAPHVEVHEEARPPDQDLVARGEGLPAVHPDEHAALGAQVREHEHL